MANNPAEFKVIDVQQLPSPDPRRMGKWDKVIVYELDPLRRYSVLVPAETFSEETLRAAVKADLETRAQWLNKKFQL